MVRENIEPRPITSRTRTGRAFLIDTFEEYTTAITEKWVQTEGTIALATDFPKQGKSCMSLTTGATAADPSMASLYLGCPVKTRIGLEFDFQVSSLMANVRDLSLNLYYYDGVLEQASSVKYLGSTDIKWQYKDFGAGWVDVVGGSQNIYFSATTPIWHNVKLVVDLKKEVYVKMFCNQLELDLANIGYNRNVNASATHLRVDIGVTNETTAASRIMRIDNVILTDEEP